MAKTYKTQGTIASASLGKDGRVTFAIEPTEPYDFPVKENGETKKYILFETVLAKPTSETEGMNANNDSSKTLLMLSPNTKFIVEKPDAGKRAVLPFEALIAIKQNRSKVEIEIDIKNGGNQSETEDNDKSSSEISTPLRESSESPQPKEAGRDSSDEDCGVYTVVKFTVK